jgi:hypothetical protein
MGARVSFPVTRSFTAKVVTGEAEFLRKHWHSLQLKRSFPMADHPLRLDFPQAGWTIPMLYAWKNVFPKGTPLSLCSKFRVRVRDPCLLSVICYLLFEF